MASPLTAVRGVHQATLDVEDGGDPLMAISTRPREHARTPLPPVNRFGVSHVLPGFGVLPKKVFSYTEAREALDRDGAVILAGLETECEGLENYTDTAFALPERLWGEDLLVASPLGLVGVYGKDGYAELKDYYTENWTNKPTEPPADHGATGKGPVWTGIHPWTPNCAHTDSSTIETSAPYFFILFAAVYSQAILPLLVILWVDFERLLVGTGLRAGGRECNRRCKGSSFPAVFPRILRSFSLIYALCSFGLTFVHFCG